MYTNCDKYPNLVQLVFFALESTCNRQFHYKFDYMVASLKETVYVLKSEFIITANRQTKVSPVPRFADLLKNKTKPAVTIEPKDRNRTFENTKTDTVSNINPSDIGVIAVCLLAPRILNRIVSFLRIWREASRPTPV